MFELLNELVRKTDVDPDSNVAKILYTAARSKWTIM